MEHVVSIVVMLAGVGLVLFGKGLLAARSVGDKFQFVFFIQDNVNRLALAAFGIVVTAVVIFLDPIGWNAIVTAIGQYYSETVAEFLRYGSPAIIGIAIGGLSLMLPAKKEDE